MLQTDKQLTKNFRRLEFACKCGDCVMADVTPRLVEYLQELRDQIGRPISISSGIRCPKHNKAVGGEKNSYHLIGRAADIYVAGMSVQQLHKAVVAFGKFNGVGYYPKRGFVHVDTRVKPLQFTR
jgi:uncharacterized protein YcbK (DUF882 family)